MEPNSIPFSLEPSIRFRSTPKVISLTPSVDPFKISPDHLRQTSALPKVDLHRHFEGSLRLDSMVDIIRVQDLDLPTSEESLQPLVQMVGDDERSAHSLLDKFRVIRQFFHSPAIIQKLLREVIIDAAKDGVKLLELRFTPAALRQNSKLDLHELYDLVVSTGRSAEEAEAITLGFIVSVNRQEGLELAEKAIGVAVDYVNKGILGIDLAGDEDGYPADPFVPIIREAKQAGLKITIHAGEWGGAERVAQAVEEIATDRIGHGVRAMEDLAVVQLARESGVGFEVSPTSNILTGVFQELKDHPLHDMIGAGLRVAITSDDPSIFSTSLSREHALAIDALGLSLETIKGLTLQALQLSFIDEKQKRLLESDFGRSFWGGGA